MEKKAKDMPYEKDWWQDGGGFFGKLYAEADDSYEGFLNRPEDMPARIKDEVEGVMRLCGIKAGDSVMDCPCGYGRHSLGLSQRGLNVRGVDISTEHLDLAKKQAERMNAQNIAFTQSDMREIPLKEEFNAVINMFYSFGFFDDEEDDLRAVKKFHAALKPGGKFLMHTFITVPKIESGNYKKYDVRTLTSGNKLELFRDFDTETKREVGEWYIVHPDGTKKMLAPYAMRIYTEKEFKELCLKAGFQDVVF
jgi:ubiquinone/menaquinone biosynthesis C-methylase UbiE